MTRFRFAALLGVTALFGACGTGHERGYASAEDGVRICPSGQTISGIDVSHWDGAVNWSQVSAAGYKFAFAKATEGTGTIDSTFSTNWAGMKAAGVIRGAYHFFHGTQSGVDQANAFLAVVGTLGQPGDLPPVLDWEDGSGTCDATAVQRAVDFLTRVKQQTGVTPMIYTAAGFWATCVSTSQFAGYPLWVANYVALSTCPTTPTTWTRWNIWQYTDSGRVSGIDPNTNVDLNIFNGSLADLQAFAGGTASTSTASIAQVSGNEAITMVNWPDGRASLFGRSTSGSELVLTTSGANDSWSSSSSLDTGALCGSAAAFWGGSWNYPELFSPRDTGASGHLWWLSSGTWRSYQAFGGTNLAHLSTAVANDGRTLVFALGADQAIWTNSWNTASSAWTGWTSLGGHFKTGASAITWGNGTIELFATDAAGVVSHSWLLTSTTSWAAWATLGSGIASRPVAVRWADGSAGHAEVFARGLDGKLYHSNYSYQSDWPQFTVLGAGTQILGEPSAVMNPTTGPEVFARDSSNYVVRLAWNGSAYSSFARIGSQLADSDPFGWTRTDGTTDVFAVNPGGQLIASHSTSTGFSAWSTLGSGFDPCAEETPDGGVDAGSPFVDAGSPDGGPLFVDAGPADGGPHFVDAGPADGGPHFVDGGPQDAGAPDGGPHFVDAGPVDGGPLFVDAGPTDAGSTEPDAGQGAMKDAGTLVISPRVPTAKPSGCQCSSGPPSVDVLGWLSMGLVAVVRRLRRITGRRLSL